MDNLRTYILIIIVVILYIYLEVLKSSKSKKPLQAKIHQPKELKKFKPKKYVSDNHKMLNLIEDYIDNI